MGNILKFVNKLLNRASTLDEFVELCIEDDASFVSILPDSEDGLSSEYFNISYRTSNREFSEPVAEVYLSGPVELCDLESDKAKLKQCKMVIEAVHKFQKNGIEASVYHEPFNEFHYRIDIRHYTSKIRKREQQLGLRN